MSRRAKIGPWTMITIWEKEWTCSRGSMPYVLYCFRWVFGNGVPSWRDLASCLCPKAPYMKQLLAATWEGETSYWWRKACLNQSFQVEIVCKTLGWVMHYFKIWPGRSVCTYALELQARCFCRYKSAWSCHVLLDPRRKGEIWQKGNTSLILQDLLWFWSFAFQRKIDTDTVQRFSKIRRNQLFPSPFPQNHSALPRLTQRNNNLLVRTLMWNI